ncbi:MULTISPECIES: hypothetical protein [Bacillus]|jgi:hypothetical protein|uniref:Phage related protein n=1 Tax=Bacillus amyloliquefaciens (strain ATCC 23350 / DSM 7 / BCRC 11601 / CCUG 28519 / NBRC 15535 / NRRL B-14393 / F) TaxID=692420 RepID=A0A9P1JFA8_BACAS|nr:MULTISPECIES: hypothetical protein [Bacillus amyloliquefaciens group]MED3628971.1 hypothetical protein [Bacillus subtilis]HBO5952168.1 hypothetical protein [Pseudomonas aeruginosa]AEB62465.1 phage-like protein [Bacillus amyloliquefaciens LL3]AZV88295.1 hypothetical protein BUN12_0031 [Bacillus amyloliquefaciens]MDQ8092247.1 hypothetical protein [Bacillus amyloliquefaciens]
MTDIVQLRDSKNVPFYPKTHMSAVIGFNPDDINTATQLALDSKVDKKSGYTLSKNDYTDEDKQKTMQLGEQSLELKSPNGTAFLIGVNDDGTLSVMKKGEDL